MLYTVVFQCDQIVNRDCWNLFSYIYFFFFSSRRRHTRCREVSWARRCVQETGINAEYMGINKMKNDFEKLSEPYTPADPRYIGKCLALWYINHNPVFLIGPDCNSDQIIEQGSFLFAQ
eukprot:TRINITY_DN8145_c0_g1_i1.p2 TRINITY_DN8145_c0_g1~~TRINITY_DN8145_c0_g1_i1.p2  ORF type:complete len:119 (-),score=28.24 TRINITY_DN8145_c0_g1_i1:486-842(-)